MTLQIRVLSWNLHGTPVAPRLYPRLRAACAEVLRRAPELVLLQEIWQRRHADFVERLLAADYRPAAEQAAASPAGGLLALLRRRGRWRVRAAGFERFRQSAPAWKIWEGDGLAGKGVQRLELEQGDARLVALHTHLQASYAPGGYTEVRRDQLRQLAEIARRVDPGLPLFAAGDLNTRPVESQLLAELGSELVDLTGEFRSACACGSLPGRSDWIDYLLARRGRWLPRAELELIRSERNDDPYSDHHGLAARLDFERNGAALLQEKLLATLAGPATRRDWLRAALGLGRAWAGL